MLLILYFLVKKKRVFYQKHVLMVKEQTKNSIIVSVEIWNVQKKRKKKKIDHRYINVINVIQNSMTYIIL